MAQKLHVPESILFLAKVEELYVLGGVTWKKKEWRV